MQVKTAFLETVALFASAVGFLDWEVYGIGLTRNAGRWRSAGRGATDFLRFFDQYILDAGMCCGV